MPTNGTRAMLRDSNPPAFLAEAMNTFMYLHNRTPMRANEDVTPYERFYGVKPDAGHIPYTYLWVHSACYAA